MNATQAKPGANPNAGWVMRIVSYGLQRDSQTTTNTHFPVKTPTRGFSSTPTCARTPKSAPNPTRTPSADARLRARACVAWQPVAGLVSTDTQSECAPSRAPSQ